MPAKNPPPPKPPKRVARMSLDLPPKARKILENLSRDTDQSLSEVIRRALALYALFSVTTKMGDKLIIRNRDCDRELIFPEFDTLKETT